MKKNLYRLVGLAITTMMMVSSVSVHAEQLPTVVMNGTELPESIMIDGREFVMDKSAGGGRGTAEPDGVMSRASYSVLGSDVRLYVDYSHGQGGDHFSSGWVKTTAPSFTARAEVWANGRLNTTGPNTKNKGDTATATSYLATGIVSNATPRIFYNW